MSKWNHTFSKFYNGETDDTFIPTGDKYLSSYNIDPSSNPRYLQLSERLVSINTLTTTANFSEIVTLPGGARVYLGDGNVFYNSTERTSILGGSAYKKVGWLYDTSGNLKVYVLDGTNVYKMNADLSTKETTTAHAGKPITAICQAANTLVYASGSIVYQITNAGTISSAISTIPYGVTITNIYYYNDILYIFTQNGPDTVIYQAQYNGTTYDILYTHTKRGISIYDMCGNGGNMYWVSNIGMFQTNGIESNLIKKKSFSSSSRCSVYKDNIYYIVDGLSIYRYGIDLPGFPMPFVKLYEHLTSITALDGSVFAQSRSGGTVVLTSFSGRASTGEIVTMPYDAGILWAEKNLEVILLPYELKTGNSGASIQVQMQTNLMELDNTVTYKNIITLSDLSNDIGVLKITSSEILSAMNTKTPDFTYFRLKIILNRSTSTEYSPKVYQDIFISGTFINDASDYA